jgi:hypothetical protein
MVLLTALFASGRAQAQQPPAPDREMQLRKERLEAALAAAEAQLRAAQAVAQPQAREQQIDLTIFQQYGGSAAAARSRLNAQLLDQVQDIDRVCKLTDAQKEKLQLAGRGDIKRFFDRYEAFRLQLPSQDGAPGNPVPFPQEANVLRITLQSTLFHEDSLLHKSLRHTLTAEQFDRYDVIVRERRVARHRVNVERAVQMLGQSPQLSEAHRRQLITVLTRETKPHRRPSPYDAYLVLFQFGRLPPEKQKTLFGDAAWAAVNQRFVQFLSAEPQLRQLGLLPPEDDEDDTPAAPGSAPRK